ncbi:MAG: hypothetical protein JST95_01790 [Bacteroidetes bacterium]|nr:hypothetical protein [Bacteroidota bacterium]
MMRKHTKSFVNRNDIKIWLNNQKGPIDSAINRNKFIDNIITGAETGEFMVTEWNNDDFIITIALNNLYSLHGLPNSKKFLTIYEDSTGSIYRGELSIITPDQDTSAFNQVDLPDIINNYNRGFYGTLSYVNFYDYEFAKKQFGGSIKVYESNWGARVALGEDCVHWYHLHIDYDLTTGEILDYYTNDLGCLSCPPTSLCDELDPVFGGGGGLGLDSIAFSVNRKVEMFREMKPYSMFIFFGQYIVKGVKYPYSLPNPPGYFTDVSYIDHNLEVLQGTTLPNFCTLEHYFIHAENMGTVTVKCNLWVTVNYPNQYNLKREIPGVHIFNISQF